MPHNIVLATDTSIWNFYQTPEDAKADQARAVASGGQPYRVMTWPDYQAGQRRLLLGDAPVAITAEKYTHMLEILPPMAWHGGGAFESFLMSEYFSIPYTTQYVKRGDSYWSRMVDATDRATWMTATSDGGLA